MTSVSANNVGSREGVVKPGGPPAAPGAGGDEAALLRRVADLADRYATEVIADARTWTVRTNRKLHTAQGAVNALRGFGNELRAMAVAIEKGGVTRCASSLRR